MFRFSLIAYSVRRYSRHHQIQLRQSSFYNIDVTQRCLQQNEEAALRQWYLSLLLSNPHKTKQFWLQNQENYQEADCSFILSQRYSIKFQLNIQCFAEQSHLFSSPFSFLSYFFSGKSRLLAGREERRTKKRIVKNTKRKSR